MASLGSGDSGIWAERRRMKKPKRSKKLLVLALLQQQLPQLPLRLCAPYHP
jgi:hypothetical protein